MTIYNERQRLQFCLLHALNNLFQDQVYTRSSLNSIAENLFAVDQGAPWFSLPLVFNPHHNVLTGNYDANVLIAALEGKGLEVVWHDRRNETATIDLDGDDRLFGMVLNIPVTRFAGLWKGRHWIALKKIADVWFNLDSRLNEPTSFRSSDEVKEFLELNISQGAELFVVTNKKDGIVD